MIGIGVLYHHGAVTVCCFGEKQWELYYYLLVVGKSVTRCILAATRAHSNRIDIEDVVYNILVVSVVVSFYVCVWCSIIFLLGEGGPYLRFSSI